VFIVLNGIFFFFKPLKISQEDHKEVPLFEIKDFILYELTPEKLETIMVGTQSTRYKQTYTVRDIDYTNNAKKYIANVKANEGVYKNDIMTFSGDVFYTREDGLSFESEEVVYDKQKAYTRSKGDYVAYLGKNRINGSFVEYFNKKNLVVSKNVTAVFQLDEKNNEKN